MSQSIADPFRKYKVWVLVPHLETDDPNLQYYYDFSQSLKEYTQVFAELGAQWQWQPITMENIPQTIGEIRKQSNGQLPLVINLCDGDEINGTPGISVIHELEKQKLAYTGSDASFYTITTSKIPMKQAFDQAGVPTPKWAVIDGEEQAIKSICRKIGTPIIIKPAISGGSMGVSIRNVVHSEEELRLLLSASQKHAGGSALGREIVLNALDLRRRIAREVMRPRNEIVGLDTDASITE